MADTGLKIYGTDIGNYRDIFAANRGYKFGTNIIDSCLKFADLGNGLGLKTFSSTPSNGFWTQIPRITIENRNLYRLNEGVAITGKYFYTCTGGESSIKFSATNTSSNTVTGARGRHRFAFFLASGGGGGGSGAEWTTAGGGSNEDSGGSGGSGGAYVGGIFSHNSMVNVEYDEPDFTGSNAEKYTKHMTINVAVGEGGSGGSKSGSGGGFSGTSGDITKMWAVHKFYRWVGFTDPWGNSDYWGVENETIGIASAHATNNGVGGISNKEAPGQVPTNNKSSVSTSPTSYNSNERMYYNTNYVSNVICTVSGTGGSNGIVGSPHTTSIMRLDTSLYDFASITDMDSNINVPRSAGYLSNGSTLASRGGSGGAGPLGNGGSGMYSSRGGKGGTTAGGAGGQSRGGSVGGDAGAGGDGGDGIVLILY